MRRSSDRILTTHAGSLVRPPAILESLRAEAYGEAIDREAFARHLRPAVAGVVRRQAQAGVDIPSDGEASLTHALARCTCSSTSGSSSAMAHAAL